MRKLISDYFVALGAEYAKCDNTIEYANVAVLKKILEAYIDEMPMTNERLSHCKRLSNMSRRIVQEVVNALETPKSHNVIPFKN